MKATFVSAALLAAACSFTAASAKPKERTSLTIGPGSITMSPEEKAIAADGPAGTEHALILLEDTECDENQGSGYQLTYHLRAKVLSNEGRELATIVIPTVKHTSKLKRFWARAITADGKLREIRETDLTEQLVLKGGGFEFNALKGIIPGVEPGTVIDYGYVLSGAGFYPDNVLELQRPFAIKQLRYRWIPYGQWQGEYVVHGSESKKVTTRSDGHALLLEARDMRPAVDEPYMPPRDEVHTTANFFYSSGGTPQAYWVMVSGEIDGIVAAYGPKDKSLQLALAQISWPAGSAPRAKFRAVYDWVGRNIRSSETMSASEFESIGSARSAKRVLTARTVLAGRFGTPVELALLYASFVRALGADARLVLAVDRRQRYWNPEIKSIQQFSYFFVAVKMPGESDDKAEVVDPSSGLPYGELPWQATGAHAVVATNAGFRAIALSPTMADRNVGETQMALTFGEGGASMLSHWSFVGQGQQGRGSRSALRAVTGEDRVRRLDGLCGTESWEARRAEAPDLDERTAPFKLTCELENDLTNFDASLGSYSVSLAGPWWPEVPSFPEPARRQPVIFSFPRTDLVHVDIAAPPGFAAGDPPAPVALDTPIGSYAMSVTVREHAFHVERKLVIKGLKVDPAGYDGVRTFFADVSRADRALVTFRRAATGNP